MKKEPLLLIPTLFEGEIYHFAVIFRVHAKYNEAHKFLSLSSVFVR